MLVWQSVYVWDGRNVRDRMRNNEFLHNLRYYLNERNEMHVPHNKSDITTEKSTVTDALSLVDDTFGKFQKGNVDRKLN